MVFSTWSRWLILWTVAFYLLYKCRLSCEILSVRICSSFSVKLKIVETIRSKEKSVTKWTILLWLVFVLCLRWRTCTLNSHHRNSHHRNSHHRIKISTKIVWLRLPTTWIRRHVVHCPKCWIPRASMNVERKFTDQYKRPTIREMIHHSHRISE